MSHVAPLRYWAESPSVDIPKKSNVKQSESKPNTRIWEPLAFPDVVMEVSNSNGNLVLQRGDDMSHMASPFAVEPNFQEWISPANRILENRNELNELMHNELMHNELNRT